LIDQPPSASTAAKAVPRRTVVAEEYRQPARERRLRMKSRIAVPLSRFSGRTSSIICPLQRVAIRIVGIVERQRSGAAQLQSEVGEPR